jgi:hypothetical protein
MEDTREFSLIQSVHTDFIERPGNEAETSEDTLQLINYVDLMDL